MTANYVARQVGYHMTDWMHGQNATIAHFKPVETYAARFGEILDDICQMGFDHIDLWLGHLGPDWATDEHIRLAQAALAERGLKVSSLAGGFGATPAEFERVARLAQAVNTRILGGMTALVTTEREALVELLEKYDLLLAIENHPEKTPAEVLAQIGDGGKGRIGTCIDTGIWGDKGYDAARAVEELHPYIFHMHMKDTLRVGGHESCRFGRGIVPLERCVRLLQERGYTGGYSVEHEPRDYDPSEDVVASAAMLREWLGETLTR